MVTTTWKSRHEVKKLMPTIKEIEALDETFAALTDEELQNKTAEFKTRLANGAQLEQLLPEAFAAAREACWRVLGMKPFPVQMIGGIVLHQGKIAEMKTGEGKTLVAVLPTYLNALTGNGVHVVTVNDYLAQRDSEWMGKVHRFMGLSVGLVIHDMNSEQRRAAYNADITYGTNNEFGFDYLRDNMALYQKDVVQRGHAFAIVDEVDSILIDEARTPLIISGSGDESSDMYEKADAFVRTLTPMVVTSVDDKQEEDTNIDADYIVDEKAHTATLTSRGVDKAEKYFGIDNLNDGENAPLQHYILQAIRAHGVMKRDVDYVVRDNEIIIVDEFTGRLMFGRRYSEGLHQAIEAKEHVNVQQENKTLATITFQNYFRLYKKLSGMTGTAMTEKDEFKSIYKLDIVEIPTNKPVQRIDNNDIIFRNEEAKNQAILSQIKDCYERKQPVLVGTVSIQKSDELSKLLKKAGIPHKVLNAKYHDKEAEIVAQAGKLGAVTIATNMAGRGTDIMLGGNSEFLARSDLKAAGYTDEVIAEATGYADTSDPVIIEARKLHITKLKEYKEQIAVEAEKVRELGGLYIIGTERHESRRIDNQLRGRAGRQGDPGASTFFLAMTDDVMRLYGSERIMKMFDKMKLETDTPLTDPMITKALERAQRTVESRNYQIRKRTLEYDDVINVQRNIIYTERRRVLVGTDLREDIQKMIDSVMVMIVGTAPVISQEDMEERLQPLYNTFLPRDSIVWHEKMKASELCQKVQEIAHLYYQQREELFGFGAGNKPMIRELERMVLLRVVDEYWMDDIDAMDELRRGIGLRGYANEKPEDAYKREGFAMFDQMIIDIKKEVVRRLFTMRTPAERLAAKTTGSHNNLLLT